MEAQGAGSLLIYVRDRGERTERKGVGREGGKGKAKGRKGSGRYLNIVWSIQSIQGPSFNDTGFIENASEIRAPILALSPLTKLRSCLISSL